MPRPARRDAIKPPTLPLAPVTTRRGSSGIGVTVPAPGWPAKHGARTSASAATPAHGAASASAPGSPKCSTAKPPTDVPIASPATMAVVSQANASVVVPARASSPTRP